MSPTEGHALSASLLRRIATPKKALAGVAVAAATTGMLIAAGPAQAAAPTTAKAAAVAAAPAAAPSSAQAIAKKMIPDPAQYQAFSKIVEHESGWNHTATNSSSGAYGLVQALPGSKMASAGADWKTNPETQIKWGLDYMNDRYGSPAGAWDFWQANGWY
ncbi:transglycosylase SLT domain-containing protein [Streptomyces sp. MZ04]|uniref:aggregation-promoting factor C-terminal-like domain-containing protein n=1 Tax=Streptomyces sp. MZ04 TaxID=2559236 RepID=UPI00107ECF44|nr:transglycosylase SLT domain-containing protein [Streptomyces sp. MZ04]TGA93779.1 lytic transglycosylase domain-containing protein [Streptomyces sp. MZ04]